MEHWELPGASPGNTSITDPTKNMEGMDTGDVLSPLQAVFVCRERQKRGHKQKLTLS